MTFLRHPITLFVVEKKTEIKSFKSIKIGLEGAIAHHQGQTMRARVSNHQEFLDEIDEMHALVTEEYGGPLQTRSENIIREDRESRG